MHINEERIFSPPRSTFPMAGAAWMVLAAALFAVMNGLVRAAADMGMHPFQIGFLRSVVALLVLSPFLLRALSREGLSVLKTDLPFRHFSRSAGSTGGMLFFVFAIAHIPMAQATTITFSAPILITVGGALLLGEVVRLRRWVAVTIGFLGVLIVIRPGATEVGIGTLSAVAAAVSMTAAALIAKSLTRSEPVLRIMIYTNLGMTLLTLPLALLVWKPMTLEMWGIGCAIGGIAAISQTSVTRSFAAADASMVMPFDYLRLPFVALIAYFAFGEVPDTFTWIGAAVIIGSALYIAHRERVLAKRAAHT